jgi:hypothetical protein
VVRGGGCKQWLNEFLDMGTEIFVRLKWEIKVKSERLGKMGAGIMY